MIRYYDIKVLDEGREKTKRRVEWWTAEDVTYFTENGDGEFLQEKSSACIIDLKEKIPERNVVLIKRKDQSLSMASKELERMILEQKEI